MAQFFFFSLFFLHKQLASRAWFLKVIQVDPKNLFKMADRPPLFGEGASINRPPLFCGLNYHSWKVRIKIFMESLDKGIWDILVCPL